MNRLLAIGPVAALLLSQAAFLRAQDSPEPRKETPHAYSLRVTGDGHVELTVKENDEDRTYKADSMDEFAKKYPEVAREYGLGHGGLRHGKMQDPAEFAKKFEEWRKQFGNFDFGTQDPELKKLLEHPEQLFQEHQARKGETKPEAEQAPSGPRMGVRLAPLSEVLADQLGLDVHAGVLVAEVEAGSPAEKAGLKANDILVQVDGKDTAAVDSIRATVQDALKKKEFDVEVLRHGKKQTLKVQSPDPK
jgi:predicted metalloprotease with PDZ domain